MKELIQKNKILSIVIALLIVVLIIWLFSGNSGKSDGSPKSLARCLKDNGAKFYGSVNCGYCKKQKEMFGEEAKDLPYIECLDKKQECADAKITGYPTWIFADGKRQAGLVSMEQLKQMAGC